MFKITLTLGVTSPLQEREVTSTGACAEIFILVFAWTWYWHSIFGSRWLVIGIISFVHLLSGGWQSKWIVVSLWQSCSTMHLEVTEELIVAWIRNIWQKWRKGEMLDHCQKCETKTYSDTKWLWKASSINNVIKEVISSRSELCFVILRKLDRYLSIHYPLSHSSTKDYCVKWIESMRFSTRL